MKKIISLVLTLSLFLNCLLISSNVYAADNNLAKSKFDQMMSTEGFRPDEDGYSGSTNGAYQCKGFANKVAYYMFGCYLPTTFPTNYEFYANNNWSPIHNTMTYNSVTSQSLFNLFYNLSKPGDVVQMYWRAGSNYNTVHTATVYSSDETGVTFYHYGNSLNNAKICLKKYNYDNLANMLNCTANHGLTVYRNNNYNYFFTDTQPPVFSNISISNVTNKGFKVLCNVTDDSGVDNVSFRIYLPNDNSFKMIEANAAKNGDTYTYVFDSATKSEEYYVYAVATDIYGNQSNSDLLKKYVSCTKKCETPVISYKNVSGGKTVSITSKTSKSAIYYKTSKNGKYKKYSKAFKLTSTKTIYAYAKKSGYKNSSTASKKVSVTKVAAPKITSKNYIGGKKISLSSTTKGAVIYYKTSKDGKYKKYTEPFKITSKKTIYAYAKKSGYVNSSASKKTYTVSKTPKVTGVKASAVSSSSIKVSWKQVKGASGYYLYRSASKSGTYKKVADVAKGSTLSKTDTALSSNKTYYYKVRAYTNGKVTGNASSYVSAKTKKASKYDSQKAQYNMQNYTDYNYCKNKFVYARNGNIYISSSINKSAKKVTTYNGYYGDCINLAVTDKYIFYVDTDNHYIKRCNLDGTNKINIVAFPDNTSNYSYGCSFIIDGNKIIYTITEQEQDHYTITESKTYMDDLNGNNTIKVDDNIDGHIYTYNSKAYYIKNESLYQYDISKNIKTRLLSDLKNRHILGMEGSTLYIEYEPSYYKCGVEKINVSSPKKSVWVMGFTIDEPIHDLIVSGGKIYLTTGTGAGNAFAAVRNSKLNYESYRKKYNTAGESLGFYKTGIFVDSYKYDSTKDQYKFNSYKKLVEIS